MDVLLGLSWNRHTIILFAVCLTFRINWVSCVALALPLQPQPENLLRTATTRRQLGAVLAAAEGRLWAPGSL